MVGMDEATAAALPDKEQLLKWLTECSLEIPQKALVFFPTDEGFQVRHYFVSDLDAIG